MVKRAHNSGFSFLEVLGAMVILSLSMVVLMENQSRSLNLTQKALRLDQATSLAGSKMAELTQRVQAKGIRELKAEERGEFELEDFKNFEWRYWTRSVPAPDFAAMAQQAMGSEEENDDAATNEGLLGGPLKNITRVWGEALVELHVEVSWKEGGKPKSFDLVTHLVEANTAQKMNALVQGMAGGLGSGGNQGGEDG